MAVRKIGLTPAKAPDAAVTTGVGANLLFWVSRTNGRAPILFVVDPSDLTTEEVDEVKAQADEWTRRLNVKLRVL